MGKETTEKKETSKNLKTVGDTLSTRFRLIITISLISLIVILKIVLSVSLPSITNSLKGEQQCPQNPSLISIQNYCKEIKIEKTQTWSSLINFEKGDLYVKLKMRGIRKNDIIEKHKLEIFYLSYVMEKNDESRVTKNDKNKENENRYYLENENKNYLENQNKNYSENKNKYYSENESENFEEYDKLIFTCEENQRECSYNDVLYLKNIEFKTYRFLVKLFLKNEIKNYFDFFEFEVEKFNTDYIKIETIIKIVLVVLNLISGVFYMIHFFKIPVVKRTWTHEIIAYFSFSIIFFFMPIFDDLKNDFFEYFLNVSLILLRNQFIVLNLYIFLVFLGSVADDEKTRKSRFYFIKEKINCALLFLFLNLYHFLSFCKNENFSYLSNSDFSITVLVIYIFFFVFFILYVFFFFHKIYFIFSKKKFLTKNKKLFLYLISIAFFEIFLKFLIRDNMLYKTGFVFKFSFYFFITLFVVFFQIFWRITPSEMKNIKINKNNENSRNNKNEKNIEEKKNEIQVDLKNLKNLKNDFEKNSQRLEINEDKNDNHIGTNQELESIKDLVNFYHVNNLK